MITASSLPSPLSCKVQQISADLPQTAAAATAAPPPPPPNATVTRHHPPPPPPSPEFAGMASNSVKTVQPKGNDGFPSVFCVEEDVTIADVTFADMSAET